MIPHDESSSVTDRTASARAPVVRRRAWAVWILPSAQKRLPKTSAFRRPMGSWWLMVEINASGLIVYIPYRLCW